MENNKCQKDLCYAMAAILALTIIFYFVIRFELPSSQLQWLLFLSLFPVAMLLIALLCCAGRMKCCFSNSFKNLCKVHNQRPEEPNIVVISRPNIIPKNNDKPPSYEEVLQEEFGENHIVTQPTITTLPNSQARNHRIVSKTNKLLNYVYIGISSIILFVIISIIIYLLICLRTRVHYYDK